MTNEEILKKSIEKAEANGLTINAYFTCKTSGKIERSFPDCWYHAAPVIFSHDFAKAFWKPTGKQAINYVEDTNRPRTYVVYWQYHLREMVLEEDPIKYLEKFLDNWNPDEQIL